MGNLPRIRMFCSMGLLRCHQLHTAKVKGDPACSWLRFPHSRGRTSQQLVSSQHAVVNHPASSASSRSHSRTNARGMSCIQRLATCRSHLCLKQERASLKTGYANLHVRPVLQAPNRCLAIAIELADGKHLWQSGTNNEWPSMGLRALASGHSLCCTNRAYGPVRRIRNRSRLDRIWRNSTSPTCTAP